LSLRGNVGYLSVYMYAKFRPIIFNFQRDI